MDDVPQLAAVAIDCADPWELGRFWQRFLGGELRAGGDEVVELHGATVRLDFCRVAGTAPDRKNPVHLDLRVPAARREAAIERVLALGATRALDIYDGDQWACLRDPAGNEFCIVWGAA
ncbi:VOC family protein [Kribbella sp. NPDC051770]|uniref:VOC family protein n=1 Tax=Kribbella sp. NPDC051770 TaxID=3155413 RepID=UPI003438F485